jgi:hypothetical protein
MEPKARRQATLLRMCMMMRDDDYWNVSDLTWRCDPVCKRRLYVKRANSKQRGQLSCSQKEPVRSMLSAADRIVALVIATEAVSPFQGV